MNETKQKEIFIVLTQSGTWMARLLRKITHTEYNHSSISFDEGLASMYSFGRRYKYYPFWGGLVQETPTTGVFGRFPNTKALVLGIGVSEAKYEALKQYVAEMYKRHKKYHYNYIGCFFAWFNRGWTRKKHFYCSEFVKDLFIKFELAAESLFPRATRPYDLKKIFSRDEIFRGKLLDYVRDATKN